MKYYIAQFKQELKDCAECILYSRYAVAVPEDKHLLSYLYAAGFCYFDEDRSYLAEYTAESLRGYLASKNAAPYYPSYEHATYFDQIEEVSQELFELHTAGGSSLLRVKAVEVPEDFYEKVNEALRVKDNVEDETDTLEGGLQDSMNYFGLTEKDLI